MFTLFYAGHLLLWTPQETQVFFQWVQKVTSVGCNWLIAIHVVCFDYD